MTYVPPPAASTTSRDDSPLPGATFGQAVSRFYGRYTTFSGRASRGEYWWVALFMGLVLFLLALLAAVAGAVSAEPGGASAETGPFGVMVGVFVLFFLAASLVPALALNARRLHDANFSGWLQLVCLIPSLGGIVMMVLAMMPSSPNGAVHDRGSQSPFTQPPSTQSPYARSPYGS